MGIIYGIEEIGQRSERYEVIRQDIIENENVDVCIIGSGAAGAVLAKELVESGKKVVLLERGGYYEGKDMNQRDTDMMPLLWKNGGFYFDDSIRIAIAQGCCLGGSTMINDAVCFDTPPRVREEWRELGVNFSDDEWSFHINRVNTILNVKEVADDELNRNNLMLKTGAAELGLRDHRKNSRNCINCMQCGFCHLGCHYETKQNMQVTYIHESLKRPESMIRIYCNCYVNKIVYDNGIVSGVEGDFVDIEGKRTYRIRVNPKIVIISAGAIASTKLLLVNGISQKTAGVGLCLHPGIQVLGDFDYEIKGNQGIPMAYTVHDFGVTRTTDQSRKEHDFESEGEFLLESIFLPLLQFSIVISASGIGQHRMLIERFNNYAMAGIVVRDGNIGKVSLTATNRASIAYELMERELKMIAKGTEVLAKMWFRLGARRIIIPHRSLSIIEKEEDIPNLVSMILHDPKNLLIGSSAPQSGNRIGTNPSDSVVDTDCRVHGFNNLFVCDASVFPTAVGVSPQITVMAIASIVAFRIIRDWQKRYLPLEISGKLGNVCTNSQPMYCLGNNLTKLFDSLNTKYNSRMLINSPSDAATEDNWSFDPSTMTITNNSHWKGIYPRGSNVRNTLALYFSGFWKRFRIVGDIVTGISHPFDVPLFATIKASERELQGFGNVILVEYTDPGYSQFCEVLKIVDENTAIGKAFFGKPRPGAEILTFSMSRKYPFEFMTEEDHEMLYRRLNKPVLNDMLGIWEGQFVYDSAWTPPLIRFKYYLDEHGRTLKNSFVLGNIMSGTIVATEKENPKMVLPGEVFHHGLRQVNDCVVIGKLYSSIIYIQKWLPKEFRFFPNLGSGSVVYLPFVLKRIGMEDAFRNQIG